MKTNNYFVLMALICQCIWIKPELAKSQPLTDSTANYYTISAYYDQYFDSLVDVRGIENMQGTGYKDYLRWKWFYSYRHGIDGDLGGIWEGINDYRQNVGDVENEVGYTWRYVGPLGIPSCIDAGCNSTGKGMMLSLWVDPFGYHSLIYAGSHHSGLWKTTDSGENWFPMTENNPEIVGVNSIAVYPGDPNKIFITSNSSLGEYSNYSVGIFKSLDGGLTWDNISPLGYPSTDQSKSVRKIVIDKDYPDFLFFITHDKVFRSNDQGENWVEFDGNFGTYKGLFDFKITPWPGDNVAYLAGSQIYKVTDPTGNFACENISNQVFLAGLTGTESMEGLPTRTEICMQPIHPNVVWFCYSASYKRIAHPDDALTYIRVVKLDENGPQLLFEQQDNPYSLAANDNKLEFIVSPLDDDIFFVGGVKMMQIIDSEDPEDDCMIDIRAGEYPDQSWLHDDIRDMQIVENPGLGPNTYAAIFTANDAGISSGHFDGSLSDCDQNPASWIWHHHCTSENNGLDVTEFYGIGLSEQEPALIAGGCQDVSGMLFNNNQWFNFYDGDGTELVWDKVDPDIFYYNEMGGQLLRTNDLGQSHNVENTIFSLNEENNLIIPMELGPYSDDGVTTLYSGDNNLYEFIGVNNFSNSYPINTTEPLATFDNPITDIETGGTTTNTTWFYVSTNKEYHENPPPPEDYTGCLYRKADENDFVNISTRLIGCNYGFVSDIEFMPGVFSVVWVACAGYSVGTQNKKVFYSKDWGATWEDFSQGLPPGMPVYKIKYVKLDEENTFLLAATDVGIFKSGTETPDWVQINNNLPKSIVTDIEVNPKYNVVYASTYGRGLWKSSLYCDYINVPFEVYENEVVNWNENQILDQDIIIHRSGQLNINDCIVYMPSDAKIIVERGGILALHGSILTSACDDLWWGVELQGDAHSPQTEQYQGTIIMDTEAVIEKARKAIFCGKNIQNQYPDLNYTGGIVHATDANFRNNRYGVQIWTYHDLDNDYKSTFLRCSFETSEILADRSDPEYFMTLVQVNKVKIESCSFKNFLFDEDPRIEQPGSGIYSMDAAYEVSNSDGGFGLPTTFTSLKYGIFTTKFREDPVIKIQNSNFLYNVTGIYASGINGLQILSNSFYVGRSNDVPNNICGGIFLNACTGYRIKDQNKFYGTGTYTPNQIGITINNSGAFNNMVNDNIFNNLYVGTLAQNANRSTDPDIGLRIRCNTYNSNKYDVSVTGNGCVDCGIAQYQGTRTNPAGNLFSRMNTEGFYDYYNELSKIYYFHHDIDNNNLEPPEIWYPKNSSLKEFIDKVDTGIPWNNNFCGTQIFGTADKTFVKDFLLSSTEVSDSLIATLSGLIDGGNTDALEMEITFAQPDEALDLQDELLDNSPYLSDTVLIKSAEKEDVLAPVMVKEIMVANPQSAKTEKVMEALENRENPLPEYMMQEILEGRDSLAQKEILEAEISEAEFLKEIALNRLISIFREDTICTRMDSIISLLRNHNSLSSSYKLAMAYLEKNDTVSAINTLDSIPVQFELTNNQALIHEHWIEWVDIAKELKADSLALFDPDTILIERMNILAQFDDQPGCLAKNTLHFHGILELGPYYILPGTQNKSMESNSEIKIESVSFVKPYIKLYPNPAKNYLVVEYNVKDSSDKGLLSIYTASGIIQFAKQLKGNQHDLIINTKDWIDGIYFFNFTCGSGFIQSGKVIISR